jgi:O-antigen ligase
MEFLIGLFLLPLLLLIIAYSLKIISDPFWIVVLIPVGTYMGYIFEVFKGEAFPLNLFQLILIFSFLVFLLHRMITNNFQIRRINLELEFLIFFVLIYLSLIYSPNRGDGLFYATRFFVLILMMYLVLNTVESIGQIKIIFIVITCTALILGAFSIKEGLLNPQAILWNFLTFGKKIASRATVTYEDPNIFATNFFLPIIFSASMIISNKQKFKVRLIGLFLFIFFILSVISTYSRSAWVSIIISLTILAILLKQYKIFILIFMTFITSLIFIPQFQILFANIVNRIYDIFAGSQDKSSLIRVYLALGGVYMFFNSFLLGVGFRGFTVAFPYYISAELTEGIVEPHGLFYTLLAELGIVGFLMYFFILLKIGKDSYYNFRNSEEIFEVMISSTLFTAFITYLIFYQFYGGGLMDNNFWVIVSLIYSLKYFLARKRKSYPGRVEI